MFSSSAIYARKKKCGLCKAVTSKLILTTYLGKHNCSALARESVLKLSWDTPERCSATFLIPECHYGISCQYICFVKKVAARCDFRAENTSECICGQAVAPDPTEGAYSAPSDPQLILNEPFHGREGEGREEGKGKGAFPTYLFTI